MLVFVIPAWRLHTLIPWSQRLSFLANFATRTAFIFLFARSTESREKKASGQDRWIGILTFMPDQLLTVVSDWRIFMKVYLWQNSITRDRYQIIQIVHASIQSWIATSRFYDPNLECIQPKLKGKTPFQVSCSQSNAERHTRLNGNWRHNAKRDNAKRHNAKRHNAKRQMII